MIMCMFVYFKEGYNFWKKYFIWVIVYIIEVYLCMMFDYFYLVVWFIDGSMGMEYFMVVFNYGCIEVDGIYLECMKYGYIGVIIYEIGYNYFLMIVNLDECQWIWMDEGINSFLDVVVG